jgi:transcriptional regulator with XRE-family HTH domain
MLPFGEWLMEQLDRQGINQAQFAARSGISDGTIGWWLYHSRPNPASCHRVAEALGVPAWMALEAAGHDYDGLLGVPSDDVRREIMRRLERMTTEEALKVLELARCLTERKP